MSKKLFLLATVALLVFSISAYAQTTGEHAVEMNGKTCETCHAEGSTDELAADSKAHKEWYDSLHGINMVPCTMCHGSEEDFRPKSSVNDCMSCHYDQVTVMKTSLKAKKGSIICVTCHQSHEFNIRKMKPVHK